MRLAGVVMLLETLIFLPGPGCDLDRAQIDFVRPKGVQVLMTERCGHITCWRRYLDLEVTILGESRACEANHGSGGSPIKIVPKGTP